MLPQAPATEAERFDERHAGRERRRQRARVTRDRGLVQDRADDRQLQHRAVEEVLHAAVALLGLDEAPDAADDGDEQQPARALHELRDVDDEARERRQVGAEALEQRFELRDHVDQQDRRDDDGDDDDGGRIEQRLLDLLLDGLGLFLVGRDLVEQRLERAGLLAGRHEAHEQVVEVQRVLRERLVQRRAAFDVAL